MKSELVFSNKIKDRRAEKNLSQEELAKMVGTSRQTIISIEKKTYSPSAKLALLICYALDSSFEDLFYFEKKL